MRHLGLSRQQLHFLSRNPRFLARLALFILGISFIVALITSTANQWTILRSGGPLTPLERLEITLTASDATPVSIARELRGIHHLVQGGFRGSDEPEEKIDPDSLSLTSIEDLLAESPLDASQRLLFVAYLNARFANDALRGEGREYIETHARMKPPHRFANEFLGDLLYKESADEEALACYEIEAEFDDAEYARGRVLTNVLAVEDIAKLRELNDDPRYVKTATLRQRIDMALLLENYQALAAAVIAYDYRAKDHPERILTFFAAIVWFIIVVQFGRFSKNRLFFYIAGVIAGIASGTTTLYAVILQENVGGMQSGGNWIEELIYWIVGVALREEIIKIAFFAILTPFLLKRRDPLEALLTAASVGLGFALQENISYYQGNETVALKRFLTANFLHLGLTGLLGLSLYQCLLQPKRYWEEFLATFIGVVLVHGLYNALLSIPEFTEYSILYLVVFVLLAKRFFQKAGELQDARTHVISPLAVFLVGSTLLLGVVLNYATWSEPFYPALIRVGYAFLGVVPIAFVFINQFKTD